MRRTPGAALAAAVLLVLVALAFRVVGIDWDRRRLLHPDERFLVMTTAAMPWPASVGEFLDPARSPLNPRRGDGLFAYGTLPLSLARTATQVAGQPGLGATVITGRVLSTVADLFTLVVLGWLARHVCGWRTALLTMAFYACAVLPIQLSHFFVVDPLLTAWTTLAVAAMTAWQRRPRLAVAVLAGVAAALAVACKVSGALLLAPAAAACVTRLVTHRGAALSWRPRTRVLVHAAVGAAAGLVTLRLVAPDMFASGWWPLPSPWWLEDMRTMARLTAGHDDIPPSFQWAARPRVWFAWWNLVCFGLGPPLGIAATVSTGVAAWIVLVRWRSRLLVPVIWTLAVAGVVLPQLVASMRYLLPIYPTLCLLAAWGLVTLHRAASRASWRWARPAAVAAGVLVLAMTASWAVAFTSVYRQLHPRLAASRWIFDTIPAGAVLTSEAWDDALPISASLRTHASRYTILTLPVTDEDSPTKVDALVDALARAEYVVLSSGRNAESLVRLPRRFPVMTRYYASLADGRLGFDLVARFQVVPRIGPLTWPDAHAEEAFTVYDHPTVHIYRKSARWSPGAARALLGDVDWASVVRVTSRQVSRAPGLLELPPERRAQLLDEGTWRNDVDASGRFGARRVSGIEAGARWLVIVLLVATLAWPACAVLLPDTWGRGVLVAPALGLLWVAWVIWLWGSIAGRVTPLVLLGAVTSLGAVSAGLAWRQRLDIRQWMLTHRRLALTQVAALTTAAAAATLLRAMNPDLWHPVLGGEKPMDIALLSAVVRADRFPAFDPWFAGGVLNYYYFGFVPVAVLCRLTGVEPATAYTLAIGTWWALTGAGVAAVAGTLVARLGLSTRPALAALAAAILGVVCGNVRQLEVIGRAWQGKANAEAWFWHASRAIPAPPHEAAPITEFPAFTFLFADLHAHLLAMPWLLAALLLSVQIVARRPRRAADLALPLALGGLLVGCLAATNAWDAPTALLLVGGALLLITWWIVPVGRRPATLRWSVVVLVTLVAATALFSWPFWRHFVAPTDGVGVWRGSRTVWWAGLAIHGPFLLVLVPALLHLVSPRGRAAREPMHLWLGVVAGIGLVLVAAVEVVALRGDVGRMNTVFKTYLQVWLVWSACIPAAWLLVRRQAGNGWPGRAFAWTTVGIGLLMLAYPATAIVPRLAHRVTAQASRGLDGTTFMAAATLQPADGPPVPLAEDLAAMHWMQDEVAGTPTIIEAQTDQYQWGGRISAHTGLPTVLGWTWHTRQQRLALPVALVGQRRRDVRTFYETTTTDEAWRIALRYDVRYAVIGRLERQLYPQAGLDKFASDPRWTLVFTRGITRIYARGR
jgi:uncharacterized membrane protein/4-amino-4-deoxy-L-arabinose transferase-like glycosyltransferase